MIQLKHVTYQYLNEKEPTIRDLSLTVPSGTCVVLTGRSGCGKTTLTRIINGLALHFFNGKMRGQVLIDDLDLQNQPFWGIGRQVGSVLQDPSSQFFAEQALDEVAFGCENYGMDRRQMKKRITAAATKTGTQELLSRNLFQLSSGEQQRLAIASIYAVNPNCYIFDEPSANLDEAAMKQLSQLIRSLKDEGKTLFIAEHRLHYLIGVADQFIYMKNGQIAQSFATQELLELSVGEREALGLRAASLSLPSQTGNHAATPLNLSKKNVRSLEINDLSFAFHDKIVLSHLNLIAHPGEIIALTGANGAGKTTFAKILCGLLKEQDGKILFHEKLVRRRQRKKETFFVMQHADTQLFAENVSEEIRMSLKNRSDEPDRILQNYHLDHLKMVHPSVLSGGQKQRLVLAVAETLAPDFLFLDEPTSGLDGENMRLVAKQLHHLAVQKKTILVITHDLEFIQHTCSRVIRLDKGCIICDRPVRRPLDDVQKG
ncbi:MAG: ABC transporter ATP-binding protein [Sporolactobacillus sp.]